MAAECNEVYGGSQPAGIDNEFLEVPIIYTPKNSLNPDPWKAPLRPIKNPALKRRGAMAVTEESAASSSTGGLNRETERSTPVWLRVIEAAVVYQA